MLYYTFPIICWILHWRPLGNINVMIFPKCCFSPSKGPFLEPGVQSYRIHHWTSMGGRSWNFNSSPLKAQNCPKRKWIISLTIMALNGLLAVKFTEGTSSNIVTSNTYFGSTVPFPRIPVANQRFTSRNLLLKWHVVSSWWSASWEGLHSHWKIWRKLLRDLQFMTDRDPVLHFFYSDNYMVSSVKSSSFLMRNLVWTKIYFPTHRINKKSTGRYYHRSIHPTWKILTWRVSGKKKSSLVCLPLGLI